MSNESQELSTIKVSARTIGVSIKTIDRWLKEKVLTRIEEGRRVYIPTKEVLKMREERLKKQKVTGTIIKETPPTEPNKIISLEVKEYKALLENLGQLKGLLEAHSTRLLEDKRVMEGKDKEINSLKSELDRVKRRGLMGRIFNK